MCEILENWLPETPQRCKLLSANMKWVKLLNFNISTSSIANMQTDILQTAVY